MIQRTAKIFYIEDSAGDVLLMRSAFTEFGRQVTFEVARDGESGLRRLRMFAEDPEHGPDLILLDLNLPAMNGFEILADLRDGVRLQIPIVVVTTSRNDGDRERCRSLGCSGYYLKPNSLDGFRWLVYQLEGVLNAQAEP